MNIAAKRLNVSILYADIRNYNRIINILSLEETYNFLNDCFPEIVEAVYHFGGTVDKFIGDAVLAIFGIPISHPDDAVRAIKSAQEIKQRVEKINVRWRKFLNFLVEIDIGISTGEVLAGNIGYKKKIQYTVIGRSVSLASQIAGLCKKLNTSLLIDESTFLIVKEKFVFTQKGEHLFLDFPGAVKLYGYKSG